MRHTSRRLPQGASEERGGRPGWPRFICLASLAVILLAMVLQGRLRPAGNAPGPAVPQSPASGTSSVPPEIKKAFARHAVPPAAGPTAEEIVAGKVAIESYPFDLCEVMEEVGVTVGPPVYVGSQAWPFPHALMAAFLAHMVMCGMLFAFGMLCGFKIAYLVGWLIIVACLFLEHWIARRRSLNWINVAIFRLNALVSAVFFVVTVAEVVFHGYFRLR